MSNNTYNLTSLKDLKVFENIKICSQWYAQDEKWNFAIVDIIAALSESSNPQVYWRVLKKRLLVEGNETVANCNALKNFSCPQKADN